MPDPTKPDPTRRRTRFVDGDPELEALAAIREALGPLDDGTHPDVLDRVLDWTLSRYAPSWKQLLDDARAIQAAVDRVNALVVERVDALIMDGKLPDPDRAPAGTGG
jgi:hypothetical protein